MSITHNVGITTLQICNDSNNIVSNVTVSVASSDSSDPTGSLETSWASVGLTTSGGTSAIGFVTYTNLTESEVLSWPTVNNDVEELKTKNERFINNKIKDYFWHLALPILAMVIGGFASLTMLTKNAFLDEINKQYVITARAKGISEKKVLYGHVFRNAMLIVISGFPAAFINILFTSSLLIEVIFSLDGLGLLGFEAALGRDYPVVFGSLYIFTLIGLVLKLISDLTYVLIDPRIDFETR